MNYLHLISTDSNESLSVEIIKQQKERYHITSAAGVKIACRGIRIVALAHFENGKKMFKSLPFTTLLKGRHVTEFENGIRTLQFRG